MAATTKNIRIGDYVEFTTELVWKGIHRGTVGKVIGASKDGWNLDIEYTGKYGQTSMQTTIESVKLAN